MCHLKEGNLKKAMAKLTTADKVAEKELEANHKWKVWIKIALVDLHVKRGSLKQAKAIMREGLVMGRNLNLLIDEMGVHKNEILKFINCYPETFPEEEFPSE